MGRNHRQLTVFQKADELAVLVYRLTAKFPPDERFELRSQLRRAANEVAYLLHLAERLSVIEPGLFDDCRKRAEEVVRMLQKLITAVRRLPDP